MSDYIKGPGFESVKKLVLKDPMPKKLMPNSISSMLDSLCQTKSTLRVLTLSNLGFDNNTICFLAKALNNKPTIEQLDISSNNLSSKQIDMFLELTDDNLKSLNISYNSGSECVEKLSHYLHRSMRLVHFDMSGLGLKMDGLLELVQNGIRKSRTLQSVHMSGLCQQKSEKE